MVVPDARREENDAVRRLHYLLLYALGGLIWTGYVVQLLVAVRASNPDASLSGAVLCVLAIDVVPALFGYALLFVTIPWVVRRLRVSGTAGRS